MDSVHLVVGGPQGGGLDTVMRVIARLAARLGYSLIADREYYSNIKGRHSYIHIKISTETARSLTYPVDLFVSMDAESIFHHFLDIREGGYLVYNTFIGGKSLGSIKSMRRYTMERIRRTMAKVGIKGDTVDDVIEWVSENRAVNIIGLNYEEIVRRLTKRGIPYPQASRLISTLVSTVVTYVLGFNVDELRSVIRDVFRGTPEVIRANILMVDEVMEILTSIFKEPPLKLDEPSNSFDEVLVVTGNEVVAMGKIVGGLRFQSYYPITPAADESFYMEGKEVIKTSRGDTGNVVVIQTEDETAAITSAIGATLAGVRAATSTSGPGFSLMVEALGWAGINEVPVVITYYQRGGPSTGLPTRGSQSDLLFTLFAGHGEFPRIVIASGDHEEAFVDAITSLNLAEKYQVPVIHLLDKFLANTIVTMPIPDLRRLRIERGLVASEGDEPFKRFNLKYVVSPRTFLGQGPITYYTGDEHDEVGHITEDPELRVKMYSKRMSKLELMDQEIPQEERAVLYGGDEGDLLIIGWGSVKGVALDAIEVLRSKGVNASYLHLRFFIPFPAERVRELVEGFRKYVFVEQNYLVQAGMVAKLYASIEPKHSIVKFTGRPIYLNELVSSLLKVYREGVERVVLGYGA